MTILGKLEFSLTRELLIRAPREIVFRYFTDSARFATWWGQGSTIEGRVGGVMKIVYPNGPTASGEVLEIEAPKRVVFSYGYDYPNAPIAPGGSRVTVTLTDDPKGTRLTLLHEVVDAATRDQHVQGWRYQLAVFSNVVANEAHSDIAGLADRWFAMWNEADPGARERALETLVADDISFHDAHACTHGRADLAAHIDATKRFMPGAVIERTAPPRHVQGTAIVEWRAQKADGSPLGTGSNVFEITSDGRIARATGFWD